VDHAEDDGYDMQAVQRVYEGMADDYAVRFGADLREHDSDTEFLDAVLADLPDGPLLDVGCGPAQVSGFLIRRGRRSASTWLPACWPQRRDWCRRRN
jgi:hypothetical protein